MLPFQIRTLLLLLCLVVVARPVQTVAVVLQSRDAADERSRFVGTWLLNRELSGVTPSPDVATRRGGSRGRGFGGGGFGGGAGSRGQSAGDRAAARAESDRLVSLVQELITPQTRLVVASEGGLTLAFTSADGRTTRYAADNKTERHQLLSGTIETRSKWNRAEFRQEIAASDVIAIVRTFAVDASTGQLVLTLTFAGGRDGQQRPFKVVYDRADE